MNGTAITIPTGRRPRYPKRIKYVAPYTTRYAILHGRVGIRWYSSARDDADDGAGAPRPSRHRLHDRRVRPTQPSSHSPRAPAPSDIDVHVFRNWSNRLAYELQLFTPIGLGRYLADSDAQFDIAHIHGHRHLLELVAARWCRLHGCRTCRRPTARRRASSAGRRSSASGMRCGAGGIWPPLRPCSRSVRPSARSCWRWASSRSGSGSYPTRWTLTSGLRRRLEAASGGSTISATCRSSCFWARSRRASGSTW